MHALLISLWALDYVHSQIHYIIPRNLWHPCISFRKCRPVPCIAPRWVGCGALHPLQQFLFRPQSARGHTGETGPGTLADRPPTSKSNSQMSCGIQEPIKRDIGRLKQSLLYTMSLNLWMLFIQLLQSTSVHSYTSGSYTSYVQWILASWEPIETSEIFGFGLNRIIGPL